MRVRVRKLTTERNGNHNLILQPPKLSLSLTMCTRMRSPVGWRAKALSYRPLASSSWPRSSARWPRCNNTECELGKSALASAMQNWASFSRPSAMNNWPEGEMEEEEEAEG